MVDPSVSFAADPDRQDSPGSGSLCPVASQVEVGQGTTGVALFEKR